MGNPNIALYRNINETQAWRSQQGPQESGKIPRMELSFHTETCFSTDVTHMCIKNPGPKRFFWPWTTPPGPHRLGPAGAGRGRSGRAGSPGAPLEGHAIKGPKRAHKLEFPVVRFDFSITGTNSRGQVWPDLILESKLG